MYDKIPDNLEEIINKLEDETKCRIPDIESTKIPQYFSELRQQFLDLDYRLKHDSLTDLKNIVALNEYLKRCEQEKQTIVIANLDVVGLKRVNDAYGYDMGDELLKLASSYLAKALIRRGDMVFRAGQQTAADEFYILSQNISYEEMEKLVERLVNDAYRNHRLHFEHNGEWKDIKLRFAYGISVYDGTKTIYEVKKEAHDRLKDNKIKLKNGNDGNH